jgi:hypothetical protein
VILADTTVWIDHFVSADQDLARQIANRQILMHPMIVAELALGSLRDRVNSLAYLDRLPTVRVAQLSDVRLMIEAHSLYSRGIGLTDAHLIAALLLSPPALLWTRDKRLRNVAESLGIHANLP